MLDTAHADGPKLELGGNAINLEKLTPEGYALCGTHPNNCSNLHDTQLTLTITMIAKPFNIPNPNPNPNQP